MKSWRYFLIGTLCLVFLWGDPKDAPAVDCNNPPMPPGGRVSAEWWRRYSAWCIECGGHPYQDATGGGCRPGPNWDSRSTTGVFPRGSSFEDQMINMLGEQVFAPLFKSFFDSIFQDLIAPPKPTTEYRPPPPQPRYALNPDFLDTIKRLEGRQLPPGAAQFTLEQSLKTQQNTVATYLPKTAIQQLTLSACLAQEGVRRASSLEEASFFLYQASRSLEGGYVQGPDMRCEPLPEILPPDPKQVETLKEKQERTIAIMDDLYNQASIMEERWKALEAAVKEKEDILEGAEDNLGRVLEHIRNNPESQMTLHEKAVDESLLEEAEKALREAQNDLEEAVILAQEAKEESNRSREKSQNTAKRFGEAGMNPNKLEAFLEEFKGGR